MQINFSEFKEITKSLSDLQMEVEKMRLEKQYIQRESENLSRNFQRVINNSELTNEQKFEQIKQYASDYLTNDLPF